jgi:hypothetical protein
VEAIWTQQWITQTTKDSKALVIRGLFVQFLIGRSMLESGCGKSVNDAHCSKEGVNLIFVG